MDIGIADEKRLPEVCLICASTTDEVTRIVRSRAEGFDDSNRAGSWLMFLISPLKSLANAIIHRDELAVTIPLCRACWQERRPEPESVNYDRQSTTWIAHRQCAQAIEAARQRVVR